MVIHLLIVSCYCYADKQEFWRQELYPFSYSITRTNRHVGDSFMAVPTLKYFDSYPDMIFMIFFNQIMFRFYIVHWNMNLYSVVLRVKRVYESLRQAKRIFVEGSAIKQCNCKIQKRDSKEWHKQTLPWIKGSLRSNPKQHMQWQDLMA